MANFGTLTAVNVTIAGNYSTVPLPADFGTNPDSGVGGAGLYNEAGHTATLMNTIVAQNLDLFSDATSAQPADVGGTLSADSAYNLIGSPADSPASGGLLDGINGNIVGRDPGLDPNGLSDNGGPTLTIALIPVSPAIDAGSVALAVDPTDNQPLAYDQRGTGYPRIVAGTVDIGAYEGPDPTTTTVATSVTPSVYGQPVIFTATVMPTGPLSGTASHPQGLSPSTMVQRPWARVR